MSRCHLPCSVLGKMRELPAHMTKLVSIFASKMFGLSQTQQTAAKVSVRFFPELAADSPCQDWSTQYVLQEPLLLRTVQDTNDGSWAEGHDASLPTAEMMHAKLACLRLLHATLYIVRTGCRRHIGHAVVHV